MLIKQCLFKGRNENGNVFVHPLTTSRGLEKTARRISPQLHPRVQDFVRAVKPTAKGIFILVNAMGASEYWGQNANGDLFPEKALIHAPPNWNELSEKEMKEVGKKWDFGYPTFMGAYPYRHHVNKDPSRAFGEVVLSVWNPKMHRVELVVYLDRALCKKFDSYEVIERIEQGEFPDVSMGCRVPYDTCSICQHKSKTIQDYCEHASKMMNKILPDGRQVGVRNDHPKFFDISFVFIGADKTAKVMAKLAQRGQQVCMGDYCTNPHLSAEIGETFSKEAFLSALATKGVKSYLPSLGQIFSKTRMFQPLTAGALPAQVVRVAARPFIGAERAGQLALNTRDAFQSGIKEPIKKGLERSGIKGALQKGYEVGMRPIPGTPKLMHPVLPLPEQRRAYAAWKADDAVENFANQPDQALVSMLPGGGLLGPAYGTAKRLVVSGLGRIKQAEACSCENTCACSVQPEKLATKRKFSEIVKQIPAGPFSKRTLPKLEKSEPDIPKDILDQMGGMDLKSALSTPSMMGIVLKPHEFQRIILISIGEKPLADDLDKKGKVFKPGRDLGENNNLLPTGDDIVNDQLKEILMSSGLFDSRSVAAPLLKKRMISITISATATPKKEKTASWSFPELSAAYNGYRRELIKKADCIAQFLARDSQLRSATFGFSMAQAFAGGVEKTAKVSAFCPESLAYLVGAHYQDRNCQVQRISDLVGSFADFGEPAEVTVQG